MQLPGEGLNGKLQVILINFSSLYSRSTHLPPLLHERKLCACFWNRVHTACRNQSGQKDPFVQILGICALIADCCFLSQSCRQKGQWPLFNHLHHCKYPLRDQKDFKKNLKASTLSFYFSLLTLFVISQIFIYA